MAVLPELLPLEGIFSPRSVLLLPIVAVVALAAYVVFDELIYRFHNRIAGLPGPAGYPLLGSLPSLRGRCGPELYRQWATDGPRYGEVFQLRLGSVPAVVVNGAAAARELFLGQREATNSRPRFYVLHGRVQQGGAVTSIGTSAWDHSCRRRRKVAATALNKASVESYYPILDLEARALLVDILAACGDGDSPVDMLDLCRKFALNLSLTLSYGARIDDVRDLHRDLLLSEIIYIEEKITKFRDVSGNYLNYIPLLRPLERAAGWLGLRDSTHMADVGRRRTAYHAALQANLKREIAQGTDRPCIQGNVLKDPESKGLSDGELLSVSLSMMAGSDTTKRSLMWAVQLLASRPDIQDKAYRAVVEAGLIGSAAAAHSRVEYVDALTKEVGRFFVVLRLALPKATHKTTRWRGAAIPPGTLLFLNTWACSRDPSVFPNPSVFEPERWLGDDATARPPHQFAFGMGGRMCVASHVASKALYTALLQLVAHFRVLPAATGSHDIDADPLRGLLSQENPQAQPRASTVRFVPRDAATTRKMLETVKS